MTTPEDFFAAPPMMRCTVVPVFPRGASRGPDPTGSVTLPTLDQVRATRPRLDPGGPTMPTPTPPPPDLGDPEARYRAAWSVLDTLGRRGTTVTVQAALEVVDAVLAAVAVPAAELPGEARVRARLEHAAALGMPQVRVDDMLEALGTYPDHVHYWQAWRDTAPAHCFTDGAAA